MSIRKIVIEPDPILRKKSESLEKVDDEIRKLLDDMLETMYAAPGIGLPGHFAEIERPAECQVKFIDYDGKEKELVADGLLATCIQHEIDHLNGVLFIDYLSKLKKDMIVKKLIKQKKEFNKVVL